MGFFDGLGKSISSAASGAAQKTKEVAETAKINMAINGKESDIKKKYTIIGELIFAKYEADKEKYHAAMPQDVQEICVEVDALNEEIEKLRKELLVVKNIVLCPGCGVENPDTAKFCVQCGTALKTDEPAIDVELVDDVVCAGCGVKNIPGSKFCTGCGNAIG